ncbi:unnamed protein product [Owenia fusiformis]|uniref:Uncharacterized protein n=1 Tax=Owenia fusiformis TaxID=6347 RepID=A0A8J1UYD8_OWEFU|nr:unnamed protein product [Owenia fusiformis]
MSRAKIKEWDSMDINQFKDDFEFLNILKEVMLQNIADQGTTQDRNCPKIDPKLSNGRKIQVVQKFSKQRPEQMQMPLNFVGFIGTVKSKVTDDIKESIWNADDLLTQEIKEGNPKILAYVSGERTVGGDWGNLVIFMDGAKEELAKSKVHSSVIMDVSENYYSKVYIHNGLLPDGLQSPKYQLRNTLCIHFGENSTERKVRYRKIWSAKQDTGSSRYVYI